MKKRITILSGDGIGPEIMQEALKVLHAVGNKFQHEFILEECLIGAAAIRAAGNPLPVTTLESCMVSDAVLLAAIGEPEFDNNPDLNMRPEQGLLGLRKAIQVYANIRPIQTIKEFQHLSQLKSVSVSDIDLVIYRELSSGIYYGKRTESPDADEATDECYYHRSEIERVSHKAFQAARLRNKKLCLVDKANVLATSRLWRRVVNELSAQYPDVELTHLFVDNAAMQLVLNPAQFDVLLCSNMFGDIISDLASTIPGSLGLLPSASIGESHALFEPVHGSYPQAAGKNVANPVAMIRSVGMMLEYFGMSQEQTAIDQAIHSCFKQGLGTADLNPDFELSTSEFGDIIAVMIEDGADAINFKNVRQSVGTMI
jgi:3-isopropylmalate dehydrogenase